MLKPHYVTQQASQVFWGSSLAIIEELKAASSLLILIFWTDLEIPEKQQRTGNAALAAVLVKRI